MMDMVRAAKRILDHYGQQKQEVQAVQELSELIVLLAARQDQRKGDYKDRIAEEIADSMIMLEQIRLANDITLYTISENIEKKLKRQLDRIANEACCNIQDGGAENG